MTSKYLSKWNRNLIYSRLNNLCEENGVFLTYISPEYTSQTCSQCGFVDKGNRLKENFKCLDCGYEDNADLNASKNILKRFCQEFIVPDSERNKSL